MSEKSTSRKSLIVSESIKRQVKVRAAELGRPMRDVVEEALCGWLNETCETPVPVAGMDADRVVVPVAPIEPPQLQLLNPATTVVQPFPTCPWCGKGLVTGHGSAYCSVACAVAHSMEREGTPS